MTQISDSILLEDDGLILLNKPRNMPTAGAHLEQEGSAQYALMQHYKRRIWAVHQLDKLTTGLNVFVRRKSLVDSWSQQLAQGKKHYLAICHGSVPHDHFYIKAPLGWIKAQRKHGVSPTGKAARTEVCVLARSEAFSLLKVTLHTGRTHQIRAHLSHHGFPLCGDPLYGLDTDPEGVLALHAWRINLQGDVMFEAPICDQWARWLNQYGWGDALSDV